MQYILLKSATAGNKRLWSVVESIAPEIDCNARLQTSLSTRQCCWIRSDAMRLVLECEAAFMHVNELKFGHDSPLLNQGRHPRQRIRNQLRWQRFNELRVARFPVHGTHLVAQHMAFCG